jgi:DNA-binding transcriptional regulator YhcF (GntR family)
VRELDAAQVPSGIRVNKELDAAQEPLTVRALAERVNASPGTVAKTCQDLEAGGFISRGKPQSKTLYLSPLTGEVINPSNFELNQQLLSSLRAVVSKYEIEDKRLEAELRRLLDRLLVRRDLAKFRERIREFRSRLLAAVRRAEKKTEIYALLGLLPFEREITTWVLTRPAGG